MKTLMQLGAGLIFLIISFSISLAGDEPYVIYQSEGAFEDVTQDVEDAIVDSGLVIERTGMLGDMLKRTSEAVGTPSVYKNAVYFTFCSAKLSHAATLADPRNITICPYSVFVYELASKPEEIVVGYRKAIGGKSEESKKALSAIDQLLDKIVKSAIE